MKRQPGIYIIALLSLLQGPHFAVGKEQEDAPMAGTAVPTANAAALMHEASKTDDKQMKMMMMMMAMQQMQQASANKKADSQNDKSNKARKDDEKDAKGEQKIAMPSPMPSEFINQANPRPAAKPPNMAPQGRLGAAAAGAAGVAGDAALLAPCAGPAGVAGAWRCVTLDDCLPNEPPPPMRRAASAFRLATARKIANKNVQNFMLPPNNL